MGYTHTWYRPLELPKDRWLYFLDDWMRVWGKLRDHDVVLYPPKGVQCSLALPIMDEELVAFNGIPGCEDFFFSRQAEMPSQVRQGLGFGFCKTAGLPYDLAVTGCLLVAKRHFGAALEVTSDGLDPDWQAARDLCDGAVGYGREFHINEDYALVSLCRA